MQFKEYLLSLERTPVVESAYSLYTGEPLEEGIADFGKALLLSGALAFGSANAAPNKSVDSYHGNGKDYSKVVQKQNYKKAGKKMDKKAKVNYPRPKGRELRASTQRTCHVQDRTR